MTQEPQKGNAVLIVIAIIGVLGTIVATAIGVNGNYNIEKFRQESELTKIALVSIATQGGATQLVLQNTVNAPPQPTFSPVSPQSIEVTRIVEATRVVEVTRMVFISPSTPTPEPASISINYEGKTNIPNFIFNVNRVEIVQQGKMRWYISFWNKTENDYGLKLDLNNCAYIANRDNGARYPIKDSNFISSDEVGVQSQTRLDLWFEFEDAISQGARNFTVGLCPNNTRFIFFDKFNIDINP